MLEEIRELGFSRVELSHGIPASLVPGILQALTDGIVSVPSVHNFCPLPNMVQQAAPNIFQPSAKKGIESRAWMRYSLNTLEFAKQVGASHVVLHSGSLSFRFRSPLPTLANPGGASEAQWKKAFTRLSKKADAVLPRVSSQYTALLSSAKALGLSLAVENREGILELPLDSGMRDFLSQIEDENIVYWHDTGHAEIKHRLGLLSPAEHLETLGEKLAGFHLHDVNDAGRDHQVIGSGSVNFREISRLIRPHHILVLELSPRLTAKEVLQSADHLMEILG
jgi:sugar phosphate isomerase/epimerase